MSINVMLTKSFLLHNHHVWIRLIWYNDHSYQNSWIPSAKFDWHVQRGSYGARDRSPNRRNNYRQRSRSRSPRRNRAGASSDRGERRPHKRLRDSSPQPRGERWAFMKSSPTLSLPTWKLLKEIFLVWLKCALEVYIAALILIDSLRLQLKGLRCICKFC